MARDDSAFLDNTAIVGGQQKDGSYDISTKGSTPMPPSTFQVSTPLSDEQIHDPPPPSAQNILRWRLASGYFAYCILSWADGVTGTVFPYLKAEFRLSTLTLSLLWGGSTCGYFAGTLLVETILKWLGRVNFESEQSKNIEDPSLVLSDKKTRHVGYSASRARHLTLVIASSLHALFFVMMASRGGFPVMFVAYAVAAFARAVLSAILNAYFASGPKQALGYAFGLAGIGAMASPLVCQSVITTGVPWYHFYWGSLVLSALNILLLAVTFKPNKAESAKELHMALGEARSSAETGCGGRGGADPSGKAPSPDCTASSFEPKVETNNHNNLKKALCIPIQWLFCAFALLYSGSETTTQGLMVTYLLETKHANPKTAGFVTSGFWAGLSIGRFCWGYCNDFLTFRQKKHVILSFTFFGLILEILIWVVRSHVQNSIATAFIGLFYGPIVPAALALASDVLPGDVQMVAMALINAFASLGAGVFPLVTGAVLSFRGNAAFPFVTVPLSASLIVLWVLFPSRIPRRDTLA